MLTSQETTLPSVDHIAERTSRLFDQASESVLDIQDNPGFVSYLKAHDVAYDDTREEFWEAVQNVSKVFIDKGGAGEDIDKNRIFSIVASVPNVMFKQLATNADAEHHKRTGQFLLNREIHNSYVEIFGQFNKELRDFISDNLDVNLHDIATLLTEAASSGIAPEFRQKTGKSILGILSGIRAELGFEQKADQTGLQWTRGDLKDDATGTDYIVEGVRIDIKASLHDVLEKSDSSEIQHPYIIKHGRVIYFPYEYANDYVNNTFRMSDSALEERTSYIYSDIASMRQALRL